MKRGTDFLARLKRVLPGETETRHPDYWQAYELRYERDRPRNTTPIDALRIVVLDTETTGLDHQTDHVISCAAVVVRGASIRIAEAIDWRVRAPLPSPAKSIEVHGVLNGELEDGLPEALFVRRLVEFVGPDLIVGYRPGFDMAIINRLVSTYVPGRLRNATLDVSQLGMRVDYPLKPRFVRPEPYSLDALCQRYEIETPARHTAIGDAYVTALLLLKLLNRLQTGGASTFGDLLRNYG